MDEFIHGPGHFAFLPDEAQVFVIAVFQAYLTGVDGGFGACPVHVDDIFVGDFHASGDADVGQPSDTVAARRHRIRPHENIIQGESFRDVDRAALCDGGQVVVHVAFVEEPAFYC